MVIYILVSLTILLIALSLIPNPKPAWAIWTGNSACVAVIVTIIIWALSAP